MVAQDSDSDFGYDFTAEEEELLHQLASDSTLATSIKLPPADNVVKLAIDAVPARSEYATETGEGLTRDLYAARDASYFAKSRHFDNSLHSEAPLSPTADILFPSVDLDQEVSYPDCKNPISHKCATTREFYTRLTDFKAFSKQIVVERCKEGN